MPVRNGYAALVKARDARNTKRRKLDDYETPDDKVAYLWDFVPLFTGPILEPACGSGRMVRVLRKLYGVRVHGSDIKTGANFFDRKSWAGDIVTNPPYRDGMADAFPRHALRIATGKVAMLMETKFLHGDKRASGLYAEHKPECVIVIPERIYFYAGGRPITSQFFNHIWIVWPERKKRERGGYETKLYWANSGGF